MRSDPADRAFLALLGVAAGTASTLSAFFVTPLHRHATVHSVPGVMRLLGVLLTVVVILVVSAGAILGVRELLRRMRATARLIGQLSSHQASPPAGIVAAAERYGLADRVMWLETWEAVALTVGFARPRVVVSRGLLDALANDEVDAVLAHEAYHIRRRDPLRALVAHVAAAAFFYLPVVRRLEGRYQANAELSADRQALRDLGTGPVAGALRRLLSPTATGAAMAAAMGGTAALEARVLQLETGAAPTTLGAGGWVGSAVVVGSMVVLLDGILLLLGLHTQLVPTVLDALVHLGVFMGVWAVYFLLPPSLRRLTGSAKRRITTTNL